MAKMKKSELKHIIRESIKQLMTEQSSGVYHRWQGQYKNPNTGNCIPSGIQNKHTTMGCTTSPTCNTPQGNHDAWVAMGSPNPGEFVRGDGTATNGMPFQKCWKYLGTSPNPQTSQYGASPYNNTLTYTTLTNCNDCWISNPSSGCTPSQWSNHQNWINTWTNNAAFQNVNNNPNQPCNHICQRIQQWTSQISNVGPQWANMLQCKLDEANNQSSIHGCNC